MKDACVPDKIEVRRRNERDELCEKGHPSIAYTLNDLGDAHLIGGRAEDAIAFLQGALAIRTSAGAGPELIGMTSFLLARARWETGQRAEALDAAESALRAFERAGDTHEPQRDDVAAWLARSRDGPAQDSL